MIFETLLTGPFIAGTTGSALVFAYAATRLRSATREWRILTLAAIVSLWTSAMVIGVPRTRRPVSHHGRNTCVANLKQIDGVTQQWAIDNKKSGADRPAKTDLYGTSLYLKLEPVCPLSGVYTLGRVDKGPRCSLAVTHGHSLHRRR